MRHLRLAVLIAAVIGCRGRTVPPEHEDAVDGTVAQGFSPAVVAMMDSAAARIGDRDYEGAARLYQAAVAMDSTLAAPWFGLFMARRGLGSAAAADSALARARELILDPIGPHTTGTRD